MNKEEDLAKALAQPATAVELAAIRDTKSASDHARRVSDASKVTALQRKDAALAKWDVSILEKDDVIDERDVTVSEKDVVIAERNVCVCEKEVALEKVADHDRDHQDLVTLEDVVNAQLMTCRNEVASLTQLVDAARAYDSSGPIRSRQESSVV